VPAPAPAAEAPQQKSAYFRISSSAPLARASGDLQELADWASNSGNRLGLTGFTDGTGNQAINEQLAKERAESIRDLLIGLGVPSDNVEMIEPQTIEAAPGESWRARRVDVVPIQ
jgi:outer membrane protein OmpA-like peptidoglycan-associated protein